MTGVRHIRTRPRNGLAITDVLATALLSEMCSPGAELWLVSGWVTDVTVIGNSSGQFDAILGPESRASMTLSNALGELARRGTHLHVAVREDPHNRTFVERLSRVAAPGTLSLYSSPDLHEKILVGWNWVLKGSMNFTWNGTHRNEESMTFEASLKEAARQRLELRTRWIDAGP